jgi:hypothetical protein
MPPIVWIAVMWIAGTAAILGGLMTIGSLLLWLVPMAPVRGKKSAEFAAVQAKSIWLARLRLLGVSLAIALTGIGVLLITPFPD